MKFKTRQTNDNNSGWTKYTISRRMRQLSMPQFPSTLASEHAADAVYKRCNAFKLMKRIYKMERRYNSGHDIS